MLVIVSKPKITDMKVGTGGTAQFPVKLNWRSITFQLAAGGCVFLLLIVVGLMLVLNKPDEVVDKQKYSAAVSTARDLDNKGQPDEAVAKLREYAATSQDADQKAYAESLEGTIYERNGELEKARAAYEKGVHLPAEKGGVAANEGLARIETKLGNKEKAIAYWRTCIELKKNGKDYPYRDQDIMNYGRYIKALGGEI